MKKLITIIIIVFQVFALISQDMYIKKELQIDHPYSNVSYTDYYYFDNWELEKTIKTDIYYGFTTITNYENDTIKTIEISDGRILHYYYSQDSINIFQTTLDSTTYLSLTGYKSDNNQITYYNLYDPEGLIVNYTLNIWESENLTESVSQSVFTTLITYYESIKNPLYNSTKYFMSNWRNSYNYIFEIDNNASSDYKYVVDSLTGEYPKSVRVFINEDHKSTITYEYYFVSDIDDDINQVEVNILSTKYYNIVGQEIDKPNNGFFIQRQLTNKGIISKKYYIK